MMRASEYIVVAPGPEHVLERVGGELLKRHIYIEALWVAEQGDQAVCRLVTDDKEGAVAAIAAAGYAVSNVREVLVDSFPDVIQRSMSARARASTSVQLPALSAPSNAVSSRRAARDA